MLSFVENLLSRCRRRVGHGGGRAPFLRSHSILAAAALLVATPPRTPTPAPPPDAVAQAERLLSASPDNDGAYYGLAVRLTAAGRHADAIRAIQKGVALGGDFDLAREPAFAPLRKFEEYRELERRLSNVAPVRTSALAFRLSDRELVPEGIAFDPVESVFYVGSLHRKSIVRVDRAGKETVFVPPGRDGLWAVLGLRVDAKRRLLYAAAAADAREGKADGSSALFAFELPGGALRGRWVVSDPPRRHLLNDLAVTDAGDVFATDSQSGEIRRLPPGGSALESFLPPGTFDYPNGIALDASGGRLYVADFGKGLSIVDIATRAVRTVPRPRGVSVHGIDGLYRVGGRLLAIQNGPGMERVAVFDLDAAGDRIVGARVLESRNPEFDAPTTGAVAADAFYYLANAQVEKLGDDGRIKPGSTLSPVAVFRMPLP